MKTAVLKKTITGALNLLYYSRLQTEFSTGQGSDKNIYFSSFHSDTLRHKINTL